MKDAAALFPPGRGWVVASVYCLLASYVAFVIFWPVSIALAVPVFFSRSRRLVAVNLLLSPLVAVPVFSFVSGGLGYFTGTAALWSEGLVDAEFHNLDRKARCRWASSGCLVNGSEGFSHDPNNAAILMLVDLFGPVRGTYHGPYPTRGEALALIHDSKQRLEDGVALPELPASARLDRIMDAPMLMSHSGYWKYEVYKEETLLVGNETAVFLVDRRSGERYAVYATRGQGWKWLMLGLTDLAIRSFTEAIENDPDIQEHYVGRGEALQLEGESERALADFEKALEWSAPGGWPRASLEARIRALKP